MIVIGVTTYNRKSILQRMAQSLNESLKNEQYELYVYDDCSSEYDEAFLAELFPNNKRITRNEKNIGADRNTYRMYCDFVRDYSEGDYLFNCDSDLIFSKDWIGYAKKMTRYTDGVLSLFNSSSHVGVKCPHEELLEKEIMGAAGTIFDYKVLEKLLSIENYNIDYVSKYGVDNGWSKLLRNNGYRLYCVRESIVQHIGFDGYNSDISQFDYGLKYRVDSITNGQYINDSIEEGLTHNRKCTAFQLFPFAKVPKGSKILIYGAGKIAADYQFQIENTKYCEIVSIADRKHKNLEDDYLIVPDRIKDYVYDYLVIASITPEVIQSIMEDIKSLNLFDMDKIIIDEYNTVDITKQSDSVLSRMKNVI